MRSLSGLNILRRKGTLLYRGIRYRRGFGVHSPFVYNLITKVIEERCPYYSFQDIELYRKQLSHKMDPITYPDWRNKGRLRCRTVAEIVRREAVKPKLGALLFRVANYFKARNILQIGTTMGISTLYLTSYSTSLRCVALENVPGFAQIAREAFEKKARNPIDLRVGGYKELLPYLSGQCTLEEATDQIKQNTRNYAKRQETYFARMDMDMRLDAGEPVDEQTIETIAAAFESPRC